MSLTLPRPCLAALAAAVLTGTVAAAPLPAVPAAPLPAVPAVSVPAVPVPAVAVPAVPVRAAQTVPGALTSAAVTSASRALTSVSSVAATDTALAGPPTPYNHCVITLHTADAPTARCGAAAETRAARAGTLLMTWYLEPGYRGDSTDIRSAEGPCDAAGYGVSDIGGYLGRNWNDAISSFRTYRNCVVVQGFAGHNYSGDFRTWVGDTPYLGDDWNDRISSLLVHG